MRRSVDFSLSLCLSSSSSSASGDKPCDKSIFATTRHVLAAQLLGCKTAVVKGNRPYHSRHTMLGCSRAEGSLPAQVKFPATMRPQDHWGLMVGMLTRGCCTQGPPNPKGLCSTTQHKCLFSNKQATARSQTSLHD